MSRADCGDDSERDNAFRILESLILCLAVVFVVLGTYARSFGDTANSRLATVWSLAKHGTWYLDRPLNEKPNPFEQRTIDKVVLPSGRMLSSKPPLLPLLMTAEYLVLNKTVGWDLDNDQDTEQIIRIMSMTFIGAAYLCAVVLCLRMFRWFVPDGLSRVVLLFALAFCTQLWGYSTNINNHIPAAGMLVAAIYLALGMGTGRLAPAPWRFALFGLSAGLVPPLDLPATILAAFAGLYLLRKFPKHTMTWGLLGAAVPLVTHFAIILVVTGSLLPVQVRPELYRYETSYWRHPRGIDALTEPKLTYLFHMTFGRAGLFSLFPILLIGLAGAVRASIKPAVRHRGPILAGALAFLILTAYYVVATNNYGGEAYGFRWYIAAMPVLLLMGAPVLPTIRARWKWTFIGIMLAISFYSAWECTVTPWAANHQWTCRFLGTSY